MQSHNRGFTLTELMVAMIVLGAGVMGLVSTAATVTRLAAAGQRADVASAFAVERLERIRRGVCLARVNGADTLRRSGRIAATNSWAFTDMGGSTFRVRVVTTYPKMRGAGMTADTMEAQFSCAI